MRDVEKDWVNGGKFLVNTAEQRLLAHKLTGKLLTFSATYTKSKEWEIILTLNGSKSVYRAGSLPHALECFAEDEYSGTV